MTVSGASVATGEFTQAGRSIAIDTVLAPDTLLLTDFEGDEAISALFCFNATAISREFDLRPEDLVGTRVTVWLTRPSGERTPVNGFMTELRAGRLIDRRFREYRCKVEPWMWFLTRTTDCRIFQNMTVPQVVAAVFKEFGFGDYDTDGLIETYPSVDYVVQYRETAFAFVSRLMEEVGICYYFRHAEGTHTAVLVDHSIGFKSAAEGEVGYGTRQDSELSRWQHSYAYRSGGWAQKDYNFLTPSTSLLVQQNSVSNLPNIGGFQLFDYPGRYGDVDRGGALTRLRIEEDEAAFHTVSGASSCPSFRAGLKFTLVAHPIASEQGRGYVLLRIAQHASQNDYFTGGARQAFTNEFVAVPFETRFRPARVTRRPTVHGPQTATVVGPPGETIHTDKYGRVKLQFHWDRRGKSDDNSSCWVRVAQPWGGGGWGAVFIPHVGHEVVVSFLEGDPDRPMVTGRVYNAGNMQTLDLPADKTKSEIRDHGGNRVVMEGKKGVENIHTIATKDQNTSVGHDFNLTVTNNRTANVGVDDAETVGGKQDVTITGTSSMRASGAREVVLGATHKHSVSADETWVVGGERKLTVNGPCSEVLGAGLTITVTGDAKLKASGEITIDAGQKMTLMVGGSSIVLTPAAITITASAEVTVVSGLIKHNS